MQRWIWILWPSFIVGGLANAVCFTLFDPLDITFFGEPLAWSRTAVYTAGFFVFWAFAATSSAFTCFLQRPAADINNFCPLKPDERPWGCPRRDDAPERPGMASGD